MGSIDYFDFSGGIWDEDTQNPANTYLKAFNFLISDNKKPYVRPGAMVAYGTGSGNPSDFITAYFTLFNNTPTFLEYLYAVHGTKLRGLTAGTPALITGPSGNDALMSATGNYTSIGKWRDHVYMANNDGLKRVMRFIKPNALNHTSAQVINAGLPLLPSSPTIVAGTPGAAFSYIYSFIYHYTYTVKGIVYEDFGAATEVLHTAGTAIAAGVGNRATITLPTLAAAVTHNYDVGSVNFKIAIYRTQNNESTGFYLVAEVVNGTASYTDNLPDASLVLNSTLYTEGGEVENDEPPACRFIHATENFMYYAGIPGEPSLLKQSKFSDPDSVPEDFIADVESEIIGIGSIRNIPIVFTAYGKVYRIEGNYDDFGRGGMVAIKIADEVYLRSHGSIITVNNQMFCVARDGVYMVSAAGVSKISESLNDKFKAYESLDPNISYVQIHSTSDSINRRVMWTIDELPDFMPAGVTYGGRLILVLHLQMGISENSCFTVMEHPNSRHALIMAKTEVGQKYQYLYTSAASGNTLRYYNEQSELSYDVSITPTNKAILYDFISSPTDFGVKSLRKWVTRLNLQVDNPVVNFNNTKGLSIQPVSYNDFSSDANLQELRWRDSGSVPDSRKLLDFSKKFPAKSLRCNYKSIEFKNALSILSNSDTLGNVSVVGSNVVLNNFPVSQWPTVLDYQGLVVYFDYDNYTTAWPVTSHSASDLIVTGTPTVGSHKFILKGYNIGEALSIQGFSIIYDAISPTQRNFKAADLGNNV